MFHLFLMSSGAVRPDWWTYPERCSNGHTWAPGLVTVSWMPCDCAGARRNDGGLGHLRVSCRADGCRSAWYRPRHESAQAADGQHHGQII